MARVVAVLPDLLFGSKVQGMLKGAAHDVRVVEAPREALAQLGDADVLVVDLCEHADERVAQLADAIGVVKTLAFYPHTDVVTRARAVDAGIDIVVPRSRMVREGVALVERLAATSKAP
jgi:acetylornithine deacetylase/succinyl-diaminopimelate desuccinylase-like protein